MHRTGLGLIFGVAAAVLPGCTEIPPDGTPIDDGGRPGPGVRLYVVNNAGGTVASFANAQATSGDVAPTTLIGGAATAIDGPGEAVITPAGLLIVPNFLDDSIGVFDAAATRTGNVAPRSVARGIGVPATLAYDSTNDLLYVGAPAGPSIPVYAGVSSGAFGGNVAPVRTITCAALSSARGLLLFDGALYVTDRASETILVLENAANANGTMTPSRAIRGNPAFSGLQDLALDAAGHMFVVNSFAGRVDVFADPRSLNGTVTPATSFRIVGGKTLSAIAIDDSGIAYIADSAANAIYVLDAAATQSGLVPASRTIAGSNTALNLPVSVAVW